jgi:hypothetical protein
MVDISAIGSALASLKAAKDIAEAMASATAPLSRQS